MEVFNMSNFMHLTFEERCKIEELLNKRFRKYQIAREIGKTPSTISREINSHKDFHMHTDYSNNYYSCVYFKDCKKCDHRCKFFKPIVCKDRDKFYGACNNCENVKNCKLDKFFYRAVRAEKDYRFHLSDSRKGINMDENDLFNLAHLICPLIRQGQSIYVILENHPEIKLSAKTLYNYIDAGYFKDFGVTNMTLRRKIKRKKSKNTDTKLKKRRSPADYTGRTYADYLQYKLDNPDKSTTEMDTIYNQQSGPYIQTFIFENTGFMIGVLHQEKNADSMSNALDKFQSNLSSEEYEKLFSLLLSDRGTEFSKPIQFEINQDTGEIKGKIFYCDPQHPSQKPHVENNHILIRNILPKKLDLKFLTQDKLNLMFSHLNSTPRSSLGGKTPYEVFTFLYGKETAKKLNIQKIRKDDVTLTPSLLK